LKKSGDMGRFPFRVKDLWINQLPWNSAKLPSKTFWSRQTGTRSGQVKSWASDWEQTRRKSYRVSLSLANIVASDEKLNYSLNYYRLADAA
jgi:hypothetical protein